MTHLILFCVKTFSAFEVYSVELDKETRFCCSQFADVKKTVQYSGIRIVFEILKKVTNNDIVFVFVQDPLSV